MGQPSRAARRKVFGVRFCTRLHADAIQCAPRCACASCILTEATHTAPTDRTAADDCQPARGKNRRPGGPRHATGQNGDAKKDTPRKWRNQDEKAKRESDSGPFTVDVDVSKPTTQPKAKRNPKKTKEGDRTSGRRQRTVQGGAGAALGSGSESSAKTRECSSG